MTGRTALRSYRFVGRVGGVNFQEAVDLSGITLDLDYDAGRPDGQRATAMIDGQFVTIPLYDWELRPIVTYADSSYTAVVSIFGEGPDTANYYYVDYHPAFEDTHLGARLLQADIILMDPITFSEAPSVNGQKVYFPGEATETSQAERSQIAAQLSGIEREKYSSWVLTDTDVNPQLSVMNEVMYVDLVPYYYFWSADNAAAGGRVERREELAIEALPLIAAYEAAFQAYEEAQPGSIAERAAKLKLAALVPTLEGVATEIEALDEELKDFEPAVVEVTALTEWMRDNYGITQKLAPFVFDAVDKTAQYAALFRGAKASHAPDWADFRDEVTRSIRLSPVETPNQFQRSRSN